MCRCVGGQRDGGKGVDTWKEQEEQESCVSEGGMDGWMRVRVDDNGMELEGEARLARHGKGRNHIPQMLMLFLGTRPHRRHHDMFVQKSIMYTWTHLPLN